MMLPTTPATAPPHDMNTTRHFPSDPAQVGEARRFVLSHLDPANPRYGDAELCTSEVVTNAIVHPAAASRKAGIDVTVQATVREMRVTVSDGGGVTVPSIEQGQETSRTHGRGMAIVDQVADRWGFARTDAGGTRVWFVLRTP